MWTAVEKNGKKRNLLSLNLSKSLKKDLTVKVKGQYEDFKSQYTEKEEYNQGYLPDENSLFFINLTDSLKAEKNSFINKIVGNDTSTVEHISGKNLESAVALVNNISEKEAECEIFTIQKVVPSSYLRGKFFYQILSESDEWTKLENPVFVWPEKIVGYLKKNSKANISLYFHRIEDVHNIFDLTDFVKEATTEQIKEFSNNSLIDSTEGSIELIKKNSYRRKKLALILASEVLEKDIEDLNKSAEHVSYTIPLTSDGKKISLPEDKNELDNLLDFLNENFFTSSISNKNFKANSKKAR